MEVGQRAKILILDDSEICREVTQLLLEEHGYTVVALESADDLAGALVAEQPDLALVDVEMPGLGGGELVASAGRQEAGRCPMVLFSGRDEQELAMLARAVGAAGFIRKTTDADTLVAAVAQFLGGPC